MHGWLRGLLLLLVLLPGVTLAQEAIEDFAVSLQVEADGNLLVTERITVRAAGRDIRRGIYRDLPVSYALPMGLEQSSPITLLGVTRGGSLKAWNTQTLLPTLSLKLPAHDLFSLHIDPSGNAVWITDESGHCSVLGFAP